MGWSGNYAEGELRAEVGACFLANALGLPNSDDLTNHESYIGHWLQALESDPKYIFRASAAASKAADFILAYSRPKAAEEEVGELMERLLRESKGITSLAGTRTLSVAKDGLGYRVTFLRGGIEKSIRVDDILIATGRQPMLDLGLENASVAYTPVGIEVDEHLQTTAKHIFAAGDVIGRGSTTHAALLESRVAAHRIGGQHPHRVDGP